MEKQGQEKIPFEYFRRFNGDTKHQLKTTIECEPRIGLSTYLEWFLSPIGSIFGSEGTFSKVEIIANYPTVLNSGNLIMDAFYNKDKDGKASYLFGDDYTNIVKLKKDFNTLTEKIKKGYPKSCVYFRRIHSKKI